MQISFHAIFQEIWCQTSSHLSSWISVIHKGPFSNKGKKNLQQYKYICKVTSHLYCNSCWGNTGFPWLKKIEAIPSSGKQFLKKLCILLCFTALTLIRWTEPGFFFSFLISLTVVNKNLSHSSWPQSHFIHHNSPFPSKQHQGDGMP